MPVLQVSSTIRSNNSGSTPQVMTFPGAYTPGSTIIVAIGNYANNTFTSVTGSGSMTFTQNAMYPLGLNRGFAYSCPSSGTAGSTPTVTLTPAGSTDNYISAIAFEVSEELLFLNFVNIGDVGPALDPAITNSTTGGYAFALSVLVANADTSNLNIAAVSDVTIVDVCQTTIDRTGYVAGYSYAATNPLEHHYSCGSFAFAGPMLQYEYTPGAGTTYTITPSGGVSFSGAPAVIRNKAIIPTGGVVLSGAPVVAKDKAIIPTGGVVFGGSASVTLSKNYLISPSGGIVFSGDVVPLREKAIIPTGGVVFSGTVQTGYDRVLVPSGGAVFAGTGDFTFVPNSSTEHVITPSGGVSFSGDNVVIREKAFNPNGGISFGGAGILQREKVISASGGIIFNGDAAFVGDHIIVPNGGVTFSGNGGMFYIPEGGAAGNAMWDAMRLNVRISKVMGM